MTPKPIPEGIAPRFGHGLALPFRALKLLAATPAVWPLVLAPVLLAMVGILVGFLLGRLGAHELLLHYWPEPLGLLPHFLWDSLRWALILSITLVIALMAPLVLAAPFLDRLSAAVELRVLGLPADSGSLDRLAREVLTSVGNALSRLLRYGIVQALIFALAFVPVVNVAYPALSFLWTAIWLAEQALDQTAARHLFRWQATRDALSAVRPAGFGMGLVLAAIFLVPLAGIFLVPLATAAGAVFYCDLQASSAMPKPPQDVPEAG